MRVQQDVLAVQHEADDAWPQPVSLETIEYMQQVLARVAGGLRCRVAAAQEAAAIEYESWLVGRSS